MTPLLRRVLALVGLLLVPLSLAVASQALAQRPGPPEIDPSPTRLDGPAATGPTATPSPSPSATGTPAPEPTGPRTVAPSVPPADRDDDGDDGDDGDGGDGGDGEEPDDAGDDE